MESRRDCAGMASTAAPGTGPLVRRLRTASWISTRPCVASDMDRPGSVTRSAHPRCTLEGPQPRYRDGYRTANTRARPFMTQTPSSLSDLNRQDLFDSL